MYVDVDFDRLLIFPSNFIWNCNEVIFIWLIAGEEGQVQKRRGRPRKSKGLQGRKLFEDQNSSEEDDDGDSISASEQDEDEEDDETPLRDSMRSLRLRSLKLGKASQQERSNDGRSNAQSKHVNSGKATLDKVLAS